MIKVVDPKRNEQIWNVYKYFYPEDFAPESSAWNLVGITDEDANAVGAFAFIEELERYVITWIYVAEDLREEGIGTDIIDWFLEYIGEDIKDIEVNFTDKNEGVKEFFERQPDFDVLELDETYKINTDQMVRSKGVQEIMKKPANAREFFNLATETRIGVYRNMQEENLFFVDDFQKFEDACEKDLCLCVLDQQRVVGFILTTYLELDDYEIACIHSEKTEYTGRLLSTFLNRFNEDYPGCNLIFNPQIVEQKEMVDMLFPEKDVYEKNYVAEWN